jgi:hypothetical protein
VIANFKPGPGWSISQEGEWVPHWLALNEFEGARAVAVAFKSLAALILIAGVVCAEGAGQALADGGMSGGGVFAVVVGIVVGTIIAASTMAFFGYVLQLLISIHFGNRYDEAASNSLPVLQKPESVSS